MLSPGQWHKIVPKDLEKNLKYRLRVLKKASEDVGFQRYLTARCKEDILFWINTFVVQINPDIREKGPFICWPYQEVAIIGGETEIGGETVFQDGLLACVEDRKDVRWPKSRDGGASWVVLMTIVWLCLFHDNIAAGAISRDEDSVDKIGDPNSLFEKVRVILAHLPGWMKGEVKDKKLNFLFPNGNTFTGEANVSSANVGGRLTILLIDEFGQFDKNGEMIFDFTRDVCKCRVFVFTHKDQTGMAYRLCYDAKFTNMREIMTHWSQHPRKNKGLYRYNDNENKIEIIDKTFDFTKLKDFKFVMEPKPIGGPCPGIRSPWYDEECRSRNDRDISMNLDIDPRGATDRFFDAYRIQILKANYASEPVWVGNLEYDKNGYPIQLTEDPKGLIKLWVHPKSPKELPRMRAGAAVDVSAGVGHSPSVLVVGNARTGEKVLEYSNANIMAHDFARFCAAMLRMFKDDNGNHPMLVFEIQGSRVFEKQLVEVYSYYPCWGKREEDVIGGIRDNKGRLGWLPSAKSILTLMEDYRHALYEQRVINYSESALDETLNFVYTDTSVEYRAKGKRKEDGSGATVHHGDVVRADALMWKMIKDRYEGPEFEEKVKALDPRTAEGRYRLAEMSREEEYEWV